MMGAKLFRWSLACWFAVFCELSSAEAQPASLCSVKPPQSVKFLCDGLSTLGEPAAPLTPGVTQSFRLSYLRSFDPLIAIRIDTLASGAVRLTAKEITLVSPREGQIDKHLGVSTNVLLSKRQASQFEHVVAQSNFWNAPAEYHLDWDLGVFGPPPPKEYTVVMSDGAQWFIEGMTTFRYHVMFDDGGAFASPVRDIGLAMLRVAKKRIPELDIEPIY